MRVISEVDHETAEQLEHQVHAPEGAPSGRTCAMATAAGVGQVGQQRLGPLPSMGGLLLKSLRAASPWGTAARRGLLKWAAHNASASSSTAMHVNSAGAAGGGPAGSPGSGGKAHRVVSAAARPDVLSSASSSVEDLEELGDASQPELEEIQPGIIAINSKPQRRGSGNGNGSANRTRSQQQQQQQQRTVSKSAVVGEATPAETFNPHRLQQAAVPSNSSGSSEGSGSGSGSSHSEPNGSQPNGSQHKSGAGAGPRVARAMAAAVRPIMRVWQQNRKLHESAGWRLVPAPGNQHPVTGAMGQRLATVSMPQHGPCIVGAGECSVAAGGS